MAFIARIVASTDRAVVGSSTNLLQFLADAFASHIDAKVEHDEVDARGQIVHLMTSISCPVDFAGFVALKLPELSARSFLIVPPIS